MGTCKYFLAHPIRVATPDLQALLIVLLQLAVPSVIDNIHNPELPSASLSQAGFFVVHLFHRWWVWTSASFIVFKLF